LVLEKTYSILESHHDNISLIEFWDNGITYIKIEDNAQVELKDSQNQFNYLNSRYDGKNKFRILVETGRYTSISKESREFATVPERNEMTMATAVIVKSLAHRLVINFIINFTNQQTMKMRMFDNKQKAINWLLSLK
jgi:hypothetical protein